MNRLVVSGAVALALGGCSLILDFDKAGLACDVNGICEEGYTCTALNTCMPTGHPDTLCGEGCGPLETCFKARCMPICDGRACPAGSYCSDGECRTAKRDKKLGAPCDANSDCEDPGVCMRPYGGGTGVCSRTCSTKADCVGGATECVPYQDGLRICAHKAFTACGEEADCAPSGMSCGVYAFDGLGTKAPVSACRSRITTGSVAGIGEACSDGVPCVNGLCVRVNGAGERRCTTPCSTAGVCEKTLDSQSLICAQVTITPSTTTMPRLRPMLCVDGGASLLFECDQNVNNCKADAPYCAGVGSKFKCVPACGEGANVNRCPVSTACGTVTVAGEDVTMNACRPN